MTTNELVKIEIRTESGDRVDVETLWALPMGNDQYELRNSPFYAYDVSYEDVVRALARPDGFPLFVGVVRKSGNRTVRIAAKEPGDELPLRQTLDELVNLGCTYEGANPRYVAVDIPPSVDLSAIAEFLTKSGVLWEHADPSYDTLYGPGGDF